MRSSAAALAGMVLAGATAQAQAQPAGSAAPPSAAACMACHGPQGNSATPAMPSIASQPRVFIENQLVLIREGLRDVPAMKAVMGGLNDEEIVALARYFSAQVAVPQPGPVQAARFAAGAAVSQRALCGTCHLPSYAGQNQVPRLAGQDEAYLALTMKMYRDKPAPGRDTAMSAALYGLSDGEMEGLAHYLARQGK
jgi:cytochrome c553